MQPQPSTQNLVLRPATAADVDWGASAVFASGPALFGYVFASTPEESRKIFQQAFVYPGHAFSYEYTQVVEVEGRPVGLILSYSGKVKRQAEERMQSVMARLLPLRKLPRILVNLADLSRIKQDVFPHDYYILSLSVLPEFRNQGIGHYLLAHAERLAANAHCQAMCLDVTYANVRARKLFERNGYRVICNKTSDRFHQMTRSGGLSRMIKPLFLAESDEVGAKHLSEDLRNL
ncbi:MAG: GNAT family N-acetyltransferase [Scytolyngbya sp. HA4215-MV1]|jgi:ribosomal protein S18 acetylase RimI-like enzyme|nr:GNAT family N-acetyltransferase [Scytolyngbya sp. HA4215-MV1]